MAAGGIVLVVSFKQRRWVLGRCAMGVKDDDEFFVVDTEKKGQREESGRSARQECSDND